MSGLTVVSRSYPETESLPVGHYITGCLDSPDSWIEDVTAGGFTNPATPGLYAVWTTQLSAPGLQDEQIQTFSYTTSCKRIGGAVADADNDCWADAADTNDADRDIDNDGLLDGIEVAWIGSACVSDADCDNDGRTDTEEMVGPGRFLTNPIDGDGDSDGDGLLDAGLNLDCNGNGVPDLAIEDVNLGGTSGRNRVSFQIVYCKHDGTLVNGAACAGASISGCGGRPWGNVGAASADNCPMTSNGTQVNSPNTLPDLDSLPVPGDTNGRFGGAADNTHPDGRFAGDACEHDNEADGITDAAEGSMFFDVSGQTGGSGEAAYCNRNVDASGTPVPSDSDETPIATDPTKRDTDNDGSIDSAECLLGRNPANDVSKPSGFPTPEQARIFRLNNLVRPGATPLLVDLDDDDVFLGIAEVRGGLAPSVRDTDRDGCADMVELADVDGNRVANDADRLAINRAVLGASTFAPPGSAQANLEERRTADLDYTGVLSDPDRLGAARIVLNASLPSVLDLQLVCNAAAIGYDAN
jgi:hypothetical protein